MAAEKMRIEEMRFCVSGLDTDCAHAVGREAAQRIADEMPAAAVPQQLGALDLRIHLQKNIAAGQISRRIADAILKAFV